MKFATAVLALAGSAAAFAPASQKAAKTALSVGFADELGAMTPLGYWDPLGLCKDGDVDKFNRLRYARTFLRHG